MDQRLLFKNFLNLCQRNNIAVWADPHLERDGRGTGFWHGPPVNGHSSISVLRPNIPQAISIQPASPENRVMEFVDASPNIQGELVILLHEYGHWHFQHPAQVDNKTKYLQEVEAWNKAQEVAVSLGMVDFSTFNADRNASLNGYRIGLAIE